MAIWWMFVKQIFFWHSCKCFLIQWKKWKTMTTRKYLIKLTKLTLRALAKWGEGSLACKIQVPTLGARDFSSAVSGFCQVFIVTRAKASGAERYCFDGAGPIVNTVKSVGPDFGQDGWLATNDHLRDFESNRRYNWLTRIDQHVKEYFQLCCWHDLSVLARSVAVVFCVGFGKFWKSLISNLLERQVKSAEETSGVFNFIQRN